MSTFFASLQAQAKTSNGTPVAADAPDFTPIIGLYGRTIKLVHCRRVRDDIAESRVYSAADRALAGKLVSALTATTKTGRIVDFGGFAPETKREMIAALRAIADGSVGKSRK